MSVGAIDRMVPVVCHGVLLPQLELVVQWTEAAIAQSSPPEFEQVIHVYGVAGGVMHVVKASTISVATGRLPRIRLTVEHSCLAIPLRKNERWKVYGQVRLGAYGSPDLLRQNSPHQMDLSLGGFGFQALETELQVGHNIEFNLQLWQTQDSELGIHRPELEIDGHTIIRCIQPADQAGQVWLGLEFSGLPDDMREALATWLTSIPVGN